MLTESEKDSFEKQNKTRGIDIQDINVKANNITSQKRTLDRLDAFPIIRSPSLSPNRSNKTQHEIDIKDGHVN